MILIHNNPNTQDQGLKITTGGPSNTEVINNINLLGSFEDLHDGGTLDVHVHNLGVRGWKSIY